MIFFFFPKKVGPRMLCPMDPAPTPSKRPPEVRGGGHEGGRRGPLATPAPGKHAPAPATCREAPCAAPWVRRGPGPWGEMEGPAHLHPKSCRAPTYRSELAEKKARVRAP